MNILWLTRHAYPQFVGGVELAVEALSAHMQAAGHNVTLAACDWPRGQCRTLPDGRQAIGLGMPSAPGPLWRIEPVWRALRLIRRLPVQRADAIFTPDPILASATHLRSRHCPLVYRPGGTIGGCHPWTFAPRERTAAGRPFRPAIFLGRQLLWLERLALRHASAIIAVSDLVKQQMIGVQPDCADRIHVIHNGYQPADDPVITIHHPQLFAAQDIPKFGGFVAICVARLDRIKNIDHLLVAWSRMTTPADRRRLWIVGAGDERDRLTTLTETLNIADSVQFLGERFDVPKLIERSQVLVLPSFYEACGTVVIEALAAGVPCITLRNVPSRIHVGVSGEINIDGVTGYCTDPDDPSDMAGRLDELAADPDLAHTLGQAGRARTVHALTWRAVAQRYLAAIPE